MMPDDAPQPEQRPTSQPRDPRADALVSRCRAADDAPGDFPAPGSVPVTVLVPTLREEGDIVECLRRLRWAGQVALIDSGSGDLTVPLAQAMGAEVYRFDYKRDSPTGWPKKRNWALDRVPLRHAWVLFMDADEHMTPELAREIEGVVTGTATPPRAGCGDGYWVNRRMMFHGRWIKHGGYYPAWNLRLFRHAVGRFERLTQQGDTNSGDMEVHEHVKLATGEAGFLENDFLHYEFVDFAEWVEKHNRYSSWEAHVAVHGEPDGIPAKLLGTPQQRRRWLKGFARKMPLRPTLRFVYHYIVRQGFREGRAGFCLARMLAAYETMTVAKTFEQRLMSQGSDTKERA